ncbi:MAG: 4-(cytidine 5'-diphospho)-2-C-methyl-D-erythritol kinase [Erysipelotrichaceae bacterium]|nr:4-(cytidine 5'-diphospho)-2-C-methyl-D-erythritol kinase [Erysipelotrichaceae bacterium]
MRDRAYGKINLSLDVFNIREDGYHDINSIMIPIDFYDELEINIADEDSFECNRSYIRFNEYNSIVKMIAVLKERYGMDDHYEIKLKKCIPVKAGLGGGTADAASTLRIFRRLYDLKMSDEEIIDISVKVGADVPFNYFNVPALVGGIGDKIETLEMKKEYYILLVKPGSGVSTREAYEKLDMEKCDHPDIERLREALIRGDSLHGLLGNSLEQSALMLNDEIRGVKELLLSYGCGEVLMSGSGSTVFCIDENRENILKIYDELKNSRYYVRFTKTLNKR